MIIISDLKYFETTTRLSKIYGGQVVKSVKVELYTSTVYSKQAKEPAILTKLLKEEGLLI